MQAVLKPLLLRLAVVMIAVVALTVVVWSPSLVRLPGIADGGPWVTAQSSLAGLTLFGTHGSGVNQFWGPTSVFVNSAGRIFVTDGRNSRLVRINDMAGTGWTTFGSHGSEINEFLFPWGVSVTPMRQIFVADVYRIVRMNDMDGSGWTTFGGPGSGVNQFYGLAGIFVSPTGQIFVADMGNDRIVRINDMTGAGWTTLGPQGSGTNRFEKPRGIFVNPSGQIYILAATGLVRIDDMAGTGWANPMMGGIPEQRWYWAASSFISPTDEIFGPDYRDDRIFSRAFMSGPYFVPPSAYRRERQITVLSDLDPAAGQDEAATYKGALGPFLLGDHWPDIPPCPSGEALELTQDYETSELYSPLLRGMGVGAYRCANGKVYSIGSERVVRRYFIGQAKVQFTAPLWRIKLVEVAGKPSIVKMPVPWFPDDLRIAVVERFPRPDKPGIWFEMDTANMRLEEAVELAARIIGWRP